MFFRQLLAQDATLSYFFGCGSCHVGVAVDPVLGDEDWFIEQAAKQDVKITHVIDTHVHADHYSGGRALADKAGAAYCLHESNQGKTAFAFQPLADGQQIDVGNVVVDVMHTPGHTPACASYLIDDAAEKEIALHGINEGDATGHRDELVVVKCAGSEVRKVSINSPSSRARSGCCESCSARSAVRA